MDVEWTWDLKLSISYHMLYIRTDLNAPAQIVPLMTISTAIETTLPTIIIAVVML